jgi:hypothetical protein
MNFCTFTGELFSETDCPFKRSAVKDQPAAFIRQARSNSFTHAPAGACNQSRSVLYIQH